MRVSRRTGISTMALVATLMMAACGGQQDESQSDALGTDLANQTSAVVVTAGYIEDPPSPGIGVTVCNGMHCCPDGYAMQGAHLDLNMFKCKGVPGSFPASSCYVDGPGQSIYTVRNNMHTCKTGYYMRGLHKDQNLLTCCWPGNPGLTSEFVDGNPPTQYVSSAWGVSAHTCPDHGVGTPPTSWVMAGIHAGSNLFTCGF